MKEIGVLFGAGASTSVGFPSSANLVNEIDFSHLWEGMLVRDSSPSKDIEEMLDFCETWKVILSKPNLQFPNWHLSIKGKPSEPYNSNTTLSAFSKYFEKFENMILEKLQNIFDIKNIKTESLDIYKSFFEAFAEEGDVIDLFTTNYDMVIHSFVQKHQTNYAYNDGFEPDMVGFDQERSGVSHAHERVGKVFKKFNPSRLAYYESLGDKININIFRLHGALDWWAIKDSIYKSTMEYPHQTARVLIPPVLSKKTKENILLKPIIDIFEEKLHNYEYLIVVGYSFRDKDITDIIRRRLENNKWVIVISNFPSRAIINNMYKEKYGGTLNDESCADLCNDLEKKYCFRLINLRLTADNSKEIADRLQKIMSD